MHTETITSHHEIFSLGKTVELSPLPSREYLCTKGDNSILYFYLVLRCLLYYLNVSPNVGFEQIILHTFIIVHNIS